MANQSTACHVLRLLTSGGDLVWLVPTKYYAREDVHIQYGHTLHVHILEGIDIGGRA